MFNLPTLPPMSYMLWLPYCRTYVREASQFNRRIIGTINRRTAMQLPEDQAIRRARDLSRRFDQPVELRPVEPADIQPARAAS